MPEPQDGARHGLQTDLECQAEMAEAGRIKSTRRTRRRSAVQGRNQDNQTRRLIAPSPTFGHSSHLRRAAAILDEQGEPHPKIEKGLTVINHTEWIEFLSKRLAQADAR